MNLQGCPQPLHVQKMTYITNYYQRLCLTTCKVIDMTDMIDKFIMILYYM